MTIRRFIRDRALSVLIKSLSKIDLTSLAFKLLSGVIEGRKKLSGRRSTKTGLILFYICLNPTSICFRSEQVCQVFIHLFIYYQFLHVVDQYQVLDFKYISFIFVHYE